MNIAQFANAIIKAPNWQRLQFVDDAGCTTYIENMHLSKDGSLILEDVMFEGYVNCLDLLRMIQKLTEYKTIPVKADTGTAMAGQVYVGTKHQKVADVQIVDKMPIVYAKQVAVAPTQSVA